MIDKVLKILEEEIVPAEGCTEPIALAYIGAKVTELLGEIPEKMEIALSGNLIKNVKSVKIPNSNGMVGIESAVAIGAILGDSQKKLMVISSIDKEKLDIVKRYIDNDKIKISKLESNSKLHIIATGQFEKDTVVVEIKDYHTNIVRMEKNGVLLEEFDKKGESVIDKKLTDRSFLSVEKIYNLAKDIDISLIKELFEKVINYNSAIANEGLRNLYGAGIGKTILEGMEDGSYSNDLKNKIISFTSAGSDARMNGCSMPVMTTSGSGNQGMTASLPIIKYCEEKGLSKEELIRGLFFSHMTTIHIKSNVGRLSAYCGVVCAAGAVSGALCFLDKLNLKQIESAIETTLGTLSGLLCDGAKSSCATKISTAIGMGFDAYMMAKKNRHFEIGEGIVGKNIESTLENVGVLAKEGLKQTDEVVLDIMLKN